MIEDKNVTRRSFLKATGAGIVLLSTGSTTTLASEADLREKALAHVAAETGADEEDLSIVNESRASFSTLGEQYYHVKILNTAASTSHGVMLDGDGSVVDRAVLDRRERTAYRDAYGKLSPELHERVADADPDERIDVDVWTEPIDRAAARRAVGVENRPNDASTKQKLVEEFERRIRDRTEHVAAAIEAIPGATDVRPAASAINVEVTATPSALEAIQGIETVRRIFRRSDVAIPELASASRTHGSYSERNGDYYAKGYPVGVLDVAGHPNKNTVNLADTFESDYNEHDHAAKVASCAASVDDDQPGMAHEAEVYAAYTNNSEGTIAEKIKWLDRRANVVNCSWASGDADGERPLNNSDLRFSDYVINRYMNITKSAGNESSTDDHIVTSPGKAFNAVAVGSIDDENTGGDPSDDHTSEFSCYLDPLTKNASPTYDYYPHDKPEISAVGERIKTPNMWSSESGTSFAAPHAAGLISLLCKFSDDYSTIDFKYYPEVVKPILMASATNRGDSSYDFEKMGTGAVYAPHAERIVANGWFESDLFDSANDEQTYDFWASKYDSNVRVALSWLTDVHDANWESIEDVQSDIDLDLYVRDPDGNSVGSSLKYDSGWEWVEFEPTDSGYHTIEVSKWRWDTSDSSRYMGIAWYRV